MIAEIFTMTFERQKIQSGDLFMPCLLSRLTDQNPEAKVEKFSRGITIKQLKQNILWNVELILNSRSHPSFDKMQYGQEIRDSVLGMGLPDFCGMSHSRESLENLRLAICHQLRTFEPRFEPDSIEVLFVKNGDNSTEFSNVELEISAMIDIAPLREEFVFRSRLDLESGNVTVSIPGEPVV